MKSNVSQLVVPRSAGTLPDVLFNDAGLYEGNLAYYYYIALEDAQNLNHPYHNFKHMFYVVWRCHQACLYYRTVLKPWEMRVLLIAALFHDFNHCGLGGDDDLNIARALRALQYYILPEDQPNLSEISALITSTQYPPLIPAGELDLCGQILRDADYSQALDPAWFQQVICGLAAEQKKKPVDILKAQEPFLSSLYFITDWAKEQFPQIEIGAKIQEARRFLKLLEIGAARARAL